MPVARSAAALSSGQLWFGVLAAPVAWVLAEVVGYVLTARGCSWAHSALGGYVVPRAFAVLVGLTIICMLVAIGGLIVARTNWRRIAREAARVSAAAEPVALSRARFLALCGILTSALFLLGLLLMGLLPPLLQACSEAH
jgi:hypothetical protein